MSNTANTYRNGYNTPEIREKMRAALAEYREAIADGEALAPSISLGNTKTHIPSVSVLPAITCPACCRGTCDGKCYALKGVNVHPSELRAYARNLAIYEMQPARYWEAIRNACRNSLYFRYHVAGDIVDAAYLQGMIDTANACPNTTFLVFTKKYNLVNDWIAQNGELPKNLKILFSGWIGLTPYNPHNLPETTVYPKHAEPAPDWKLCGGNCLECACRGVGCWQLQKGEILAFEIH